MFYISYLLIQILVILVQNKIIVIILFYLYQVYTHTKNHYTLTAYIMQTSTCSAHLVQINSKEPMSICIRSLIELTVCTLQLRVNEFSCHQQYSIYDKKYIVNNYYDLRSTLKKHLIRNVLIWLHWIFLEEMMVFTLWKQKYIYS